ncbi:MAG: hypothetical protein ABIR32_15860 [Ilumatobacteraceae bacterium]
MALTFGSYVLARPIGIGAVVALTTVNYLGVHKTVLLTRVIITIVLASLLAVTLPLVAVVGGLVLLVSGSLTWSATRKWHVG